MDSNNVKAQGLSQVMGKDVNKKDFKISKTDNNGTSKKTPTIPWDVQLDVHLIGDLAGIKGVLGLGSRSDALELLMREPLKKILKDAYKNGNHNAYEAFKMFKQTFIYKTLPKAKRLFKKRRIND